MSFKTLIKKIAYLVFTLWMVITITFLMMKSIPGDPFTDEKALSHEIHTTLRKSYGLDDPIVVQYFKYLKAVVTGDLGPSLIYHRPVTAIIKETFPVSAILGLEALILAFAVGIFCGVISALKENKWQDKLFMLGASFGISVPSFILAALLQYVLAIKLQLFPIARWGTFAQSVLPAVALAAMPIAYISRLVRANMIEVLKSDYIKTAYAKGLTQTQILFRHALKNAISPLVPYLAQLSANILLGSFVVEKIFGIPGLGQWFVNSISNRDYTLIMATTLFYSLILLIFVFIADLLQASLDPRTRGLDESSI
jgi:oligopeptide transport system permease protein